MFGFFTDFIQKSQDIKPSDLKDFCYLESLFWLNRFDDYLEKLNSIDKENRKLFILCFKLFALDYIPSFYSKNFLNSESYDYEIESKKLLKDFYEAIDFRLDQKFTYLPFVMFDIFVYVLQISKTLFENHKLSFSEYINLKLNVMQKINQIETDYNDLTNNNQIWSALFYNRIADVYSYYEEFSHKTIMYYEKSLSAKLNIFALHGLVDILYDKDKKDEAWKYILNFEKSLNKNLYCDLAIENIEKTEFYDFFDLKSRFSTYQSLQDEMNNYMKAIELIEAMPHQTIVETYPIYNLGLLLSKKEKKYCLAEKTFKRSLELLEKATGIDIKQLDNKNFVFFLNDFQDYLYEICNCQIELKKQEDYKNTLTKLENIKYKLDYVEYRNERASIDYDIALLESKINTKNNNYDNLIQRIEKTLKENENFLSEEQKSDLTARLAYSYFQTDNINKYNELINEAIALNPQNEIILKIATPNTHKYFLSKDHLKNFYKSFLYGAPFLVLFLLFVCVGLYLKKLPDVLLITTLILSFILSLVTFLEPIIKKFSFGTKGFEIEFKHKNPKIDL
ncbi:MAG: hypothetical protein ACP5PO_08350 [Desulfurella sp.]|uniref:hypothetical protein n=1 Tax=Desulfurella sp. TaxID=1962857 RepID=UPI003D134EFA